MPSSFKRLALLAALVSCSACGANDPSPSAAPDKMRVIAHPFISATVLHMAKEEGFFEEQNLDVEFVKLARNMDAIPALARGEVDAGMGQLTVNILNAIAGGAKIRLVAGTTYLATDSCVSSAVVARRELLESGQLEDIGQLRDLRFELDVILPQGYYVHRLLAPHGYTLDDLDIVNLPVPANVDALTGGSIDLTVLSEPYLTKVLDSGEAVIFRATHQLVPDYQVSSVLFGSRLLEERPDLGQRFMVAVVKALRQFRDGKTSRNLEIVERATRLSRPILDSVCWPSAREDARVVSSGLSEFQQWLVTRGLIERVLSDEEYIDHRFVEYADRVLGP